MRKQKVWRNFWIVPVTLLAGCVAITFPDPEPPPEAVLEGTWELVTEADSEGAQRFWVFDENGELVEARYVVGNVTITENVLDQKTTLDGDNLTVQLGTDNRNYLFEGILNAERNRAEGGVTINLTMFTISIRVDEGAASLVKQEST